MEGSPVMQLTGGEILERELKMHNVSAIEFVHILEVINQYMAWERQPVGEWEIW